MPKRVLFGLSVYILVGASQSWALTCKDVFAARVSTEQVAQFQAVLAARVQQLNSVDRVADFLQQVGGIDAAAVAPLPGSNFGLLRLPEQPTEQNRRRSQLVDMSAQLMRLLGPDGFSDLAYKLLSAHPHEARAAVRASFDAFGQGNQGWVGVIADHLQSKMTFFTPEQMLNLKVRSEGLSRDRDFLPLLGRTWRQVRASNPEWEREVAAGEAFERLFGDLQKLNAPILKGQFMERFEQADSVVREYMLSQIIEERPSASGQRSIGLKGDSSEAQIAAIEAVTLKPLVEIQEQAYFSYVRPDGSRPDMTQVRSSEVASVAVHHLIRRGGDIGNERSFSAARLILAQKRYEPRIDQATKLVSQWMSGLEPSRLEGKAALNFAAYELSLLARRAHGFSAETPKPNVNKVVLEQREVEPEYLFTLVRFHGVIDLRNFPELKASVVRHFKRSRSAFSSVEYFFAQQLSAGRISERHFQDLKALLAKFKVDLGFVRGTASPVRPMAPVPAAAQAPSAAAAPIAAGESASAPESAVVPEPSDSRAAPAAESTSESEAPAPAERPYRRRRGGNW